LPSPFYSDQALADRRNYIAALWNRFHWVGNLTATPLHPIGQDYVCNMQPIRNAAVAECAVWLLHDCTNPATTPHAGE
jgi:hypothetical protein